MKISLNVKEGGAYSNHSTLKGNSDLYRLLTMESSDEPKQLYSIGRSEQRQIRHRFSEIGLAVSKERWVALDTRPRAMSPTVVIKRDGALSRGEV